MPKRKPGFTLVELLVVIAIIGILISLLLPAVQAAREAARRVQCGNQLRQTALAMVQYEYMHGQFPAGGGYDNHHPTWARALLPHLERQAHFDLFNGSYSVGHAANEAAVTLPVQTYVCPSDAAVSDAVMGHRCTLKNNSYLRGHVLWYMASMGPTKPDSCPFSTEHYACQGANFGSTSTPESLTFVGMFGRTHVGLPAALVRDGLSNTFMIGETLPRHCFHNTAFGANFMVTGTQIPLNTMEGQEGQSDDWSQTELHNRNPFNRACGFKSAHPGGAMFAMGDGSVHFVATSIDYRVYNLLGARASGEAALLP